MIFQEGLDATPIDEIIPNVLENIDQNQQRNQRENREDNQSLLKDGQRLTFDSRKIVERVSTDRRLIYSASTFYEYRGGCYKEISEEIIKRWIMELTHENLSKRTAEEIIYFLQAQIFIEVENLNNTDYLNLKNGLLDLDSGRLLAHSPDFYSTIQLDINYDPSAQCPKWLKALDGIFPGEKEKIDDLQEYFGLCFSKETKFEKALLCIGEGANGKSVVLNTIARLLGKQNVSAIPLEKFDNHHYLANLFGKLANISIETNAKSEVYDSIFKAVVTGDLIEVDPKFKKPFTFNPFCKLIFATNNLPRVDDKTDAYYRRLLIIRFGRQFKEEEQNKNLREELLSELDGLLIWCLEGLKRLRARGHFEVKGYMQKEVEDYRTENNSVLVVLNELCEISPKADISKTELYQVYSKWCQQNGFRPLGKLKFGKELKRHLGDQISDGRLTDGDRIWVGIKLRDGWGNEFTIYPDIKNGYDKNRYE